MAGLKPGHDCFSPTCYTPGAFHSAGTMSQTPSLKDFRRIVVKVGSSLLVDQTAASRFGTEARLPRFRGDQAFELLVLRAGRVPTNRSDAREVRARLVKLALRYVQRAGINQRR